MKDKLIIAAAGSGKTTYLVEEALKIKDGKVLITTFTEANESEIRKKIILKNKFIPENVIIQTWFSFLLQHGVRPFQGFLYDKNVQGLLLVNEISGKKYTNANGKPVCYSEKEFEKHYFSPKLQIYSDKIAKFVIKCNQKCNGKVIERISKIYSNIYIDEVQDLAGYDLEIVEQFFKSKSRVLLVGDPRQSTYSTNNSPKNSNFRKEKIVWFFKNKIKNLLIDESSLNVNFRSIKPICDISNILFPNYYATTSGNNLLTGHDGIFFVRKKDIEKYLKKFEPVQLRHSKKEIVNEEFKVMNFGESKGLTFDRVIIYPTIPIVNWLKEYNSQLAETSRSGFYVALTRARFSVAIVNDSEDINKDIFHYNFDD